MEKIFIMGLHQHGNIEKQMNVVTIRSNEIEFSHNNIAQELANQLTHQANNPNAVFNMRIDVTKFLECKVVSVNSSSLVISFNAQIN